MFPDRTAGRPHGYVQSDLQSQEYKCLPCRDKFCSHGLRSAPLLHVKEYALSQALSGKQWSGYKVVEGKSNRKYTDEKKVAEAVKAAGKNPYSEPEVLGITAMTKLLGGKKKFDELLSKYVCKPQGKPTLVPDSDKRKAWNQAQEDFKE